MSQELGKWNNQDRTSPARGGGAKDEVWSNNSAGADKDEPTNSSSFKRPTYDRNSSTNNQDYNNRPPRTDMQCYNCQEMGHMSRSCPNPKK